MVGLDIGNHMMRRINAQLAQVIQLSGLAGLYTDPSIRVGGAVMGFVAGVPASLVPCTRALVLVLGPLPVTALYGIEFLLVGGHTALALVGPVALALAVGLLFVH